MDKKGLVRSVILADPDAEIFAGLCTSPVYQPCVPGTVRSSHNQQEILIDHFLRRENFPGDGITSFKLDQLSIPWSTTCAPLTRRIDIQLLTDLGFGYARLIL